MCSHNGSNILDGFDSVVRDDHIIVVDKYSSENRVHSVRHTPFLAKILSRRSRLSCDVKQSLAKCSNKSSLEPN